MVRATILFLLAAMALAGGCERRQQSPNQVVIYTSVDDPISRPILRDFESRTGIRVLIKTDGEANKTVGLAQTLEAERDNPQADVWWSNEPFHSVALAERGVLTAYNSPAASEIPAEYKDAQGRWVGAALRMRVLAVTCEPAQKDAVGGVRGLQDLLDPKFKDRIAMANPSAGTTAGHVAALYAAWGPEKATAFFQGLHANGVKLLGGNGEVAKAVAGGQMWVGLTDNDDVSNMGSIKRLRMVPPDQDDQGSGTLLIPCTVGLVKGARHPESARQLIDYLLSREVEKRMIDQRFAMYSVREGGERSLVKSLRVDYSIVAEQMPRVIPKTIEILEGR